jgi:hypothetical protein
MNTTKLATGFDFEPLPDGNVLIEFFGDDGHTFNKQIVTAKVMRSMAVISVATDVIMKQGIESGKELMTRMLARKKQ